jgi:hypothetical protein
MVSQRVTFELSRTPRTATFSRAPPLSPSAFIRSADKLVSGALADFDFLYGKLWRLKRRTKILYILRNAQRSGSGTWIWVLSRRKNIFR